MASLRASFLVYVGTRTLALSTGASVSDIGTWTTYLQFSWTDSTHHVGQCSRDLKTSLFFATTNGALLTMI